MGRTLSGVRIVEHATAFRLTPGRRDDRILQMAQADGPAVVVGLEIEGGSGGPAQFEALSKRLRSEGFKVVGARPGKMTDAEGVTLTRNTPGLRAKEARADPVASCCERGWLRRGEAPETASRWWGADRKRPVREQRDGIRLVAGLWTASYLDELQGFPTGALCDLVDATSGAWAWLEAHPLGGRVPPEAVQETTVPSGHDAHPEDLDDAVPQRWRP